ncbi:hypothetical protein [Luteococcus sp. H101]|uniref:hypothetical protein n=1 Tax=Luteococcus sp. H101 TaxID=3139402 RepID=UPI00313AC985
MTTIRYWIARLVTLVMTPIRLVREGAADLGGACPRPSQAHRRGHLPPGQRHHRRPGQ